MSNVILKILSHIDKTITDLSFAATRRNMKTTGTGIGKLRAYSDCLKIQLPAAFSDKIFVDFDRHLSYMEKFFEEKNFEWILNNLSDIAEADLPAIKQTLNMLMEASKNKQVSRGYLSNKVFIVHGKDFESANELKAILIELGLIPIILHEQPSRGRTVVEKLEEYSDVGYAFAILTPDDSGLSSEEAIRLFTAAIGKENPTPDDLKRFLESDDPRAAYAVIQFLSLFKQRARQNVVMEFGYFMGMLGRERVCCLYKGDVELPSDMHGIVYVPFNKSVNEARPMIIKELRAAGYKIPTS